MALDDPAAWLYKGEGASNVVLDYHGSDPALVGRVLRIRKARFLACEPVLSDVERELWSDWPGVASATDEDELRHAYVRDVMVPLLGEEYVDSGTVTPAGREFLIDVADRIRDKRPAWRVEEADLDFSCKNVVVVADHTLLFDVPGGLQEKASTVSVEIKPKWGYLPSSGAIAACNQIKREVSRFTMHQLLKLSQNKVREASTYCPLDLFSGTRERIEKALNALFKCPQNNLRLFIDGDRVFTGSLDGEFDSTDDIAKRDFLESSLANFSESEKGQRLQLLQDLVTEILFSTDALAKLLRAQLDDVFDVEGIVHVFYGYMHLDCAECARHKQALTDSELERQEIISRFHAMSIKEQKESLCRFLIAATAKDCSLMITLRAVSSAPGAKNIISCRKTGRSYVYKISFLDLDLKRLDKVPYYFNLDQSIVKFYTDSKAAAR